MVVAVTAIQAPTSRGPEPCTERTLTQMAGAACNKGVKSDNEYKSFSGFAFVPQSVKQAHSMAHAMAGNAVADLTSPVKTDEHEVFISSPSLCITPLDMARTGLGAERLCEQTTRRGGTPEK